MKTFDTKKLNKIAKPDSNNWIEKAKWRRTNKVWLDKSAKIALKILRYLRENKISQKELAKQLDVTPQNISKILKGHQNLKIETIVKFESVLGISLIEIPEFQFTTNYSSPDLNIFSSNTKSKQYKSSSSYLELLNSKIPVDSKNKLAA